MFEIGPGVFVSYHIVIFFSHYEIPAGSHKLLWVQISNRLPQAMIVEDCRAHVSAAFADGTSS